MPASSTDLRVSKDVHALKPIQATQFWTFDNALSLLKTGNDIYIADALDEFLLSNKQLIMNPSPFSSGSESSSPQVKKGAKEISLRNVLYSDFTASTIDDAEKLYSILKLDKVELVRIISQTNKRVPEKKLHNSEKLKSKLPDDRQRFLENERLLLYTSKVLRERRTILKIVVELLNSINGQNSSAIIRNFGKDIYLSSTYAKDIITAFEQALTSLSTKSYESGLSSELDELVYKETILYAIQLAKVLTELTSGPFYKDKETTQQWFQLMASNNYILALGPHIKYQESFNLLQALSTSISIVFLDLIDTFDVADNNKAVPTSFITDVEVFKALNESITDDSNENSVVMYSWLIILMRKFYFLQEYSTLPSSNTFLQNFSFDALDVTINKLSIRCNNLNVFDELNRVNELLKFDSLHSSILSTVVISAMPLIESLTPDIATTIQSIMKNCPNSIIEKFFENEFTINNIVLARAKFPLALTPYLRIASINGSFAFHEFSELKSYIQLFKKDEFNRLYTIDDENTELVKLTEFIDVYPPYEYNKKLSLLLSQGTKAKILPTSNSDEVLVTFLYKYNGWALLGRVLQNVSKLFTGSDGDKVDVVVLIINSLTQVTIDCNIDQVKQVLEYMSAYTDDSDILEVILRLLEQGLHSRNVRVLEAVIELLSRLMPFLSYRIWPYLSKSSLLSHNGKEGLAANIFGAIEMVNSDYSFTVVLIRLTESLVQNCLSLDEDYPQKSKGIILSKFVNHLVSVFESFTHCRFNKAYQKLEVGVSILDVFSNVLNYTYGIDEDTKAINKVTKVFSESATSILESFLVVGDEYARSASPILTMIDSMDTNLNLYEISDVSGFLYDSWIRGALSFSSLIINIRSILNYPPSSFEQSLFGKLPKLVLSYAQYASVRSNVLDLITSLTNGKWPEDAKPSLLSHLGRDYAQVLLHSLASDLDNSFDDYRLKISLYDFICAVMEGSQEGLSVLFISGRDVFGDFTKTPKETDNLKHISLLQILKKNIRDINYYPNFVSLHLVDAIALASNSWTTARENENDLDFINELITKIQLTITEKPQSIDDYINRCYSEKLVSKIAQILSLFLFTSRNDDCKKNIINLVTSHDFIEISKSKFTIKDYQPSLHTNLQVSFENEFPKFKLSQFTSVFSKRNRFGISVVYNLGLMDRLFQNEANWPQLREEVIAASVNLQYLDSQISSAKSFGALFTAYCRRFNAVSSPKLLDFTAHLLKLNIIEGIPAEIFESIYHERIELAFFLMYSVYKNSEVKKDTKLVFEIIKNSSALLSSASMNFLSSLADSSGYYRPLLRILYCSLNLIKDDAGILLEYFSVFRDLFGLIITKGTRTLLIELQNDVYLSRTNKNHKSTKMNDKIDDLMIILSILKVFVKMKSSSNLHHEMATLVNDDGTIKSLLNLYSFSHSIEVNDEHIFAQLSLMFIQELMVIEIIAERLVAAGLFVVIVESPISSPVRAGSTSVSSGAQYHSIWTNGILPIIITSLTKLGPSVIPEVCLALQLFGKQIETCIDSWAKDSSTIRISSSTVAETSQILIIFQLLQSMNVIEYLNDNGLATENAEGEIIDMKVLPGLSTESKREEFVDCINNLLKHPKFLTSRVAPSSLEEQSIIEKGGEEYDNFVKELIQEIRDLKDVFS
ncbi:nucleoporin [Scheffersomyces xylosifermentans]|uniref:nucleoporin n=1 Tax=Scheffersomyces xylosifermentans TaxID=1304137 RepID=UPI00315DB6AF